MNEQQTRIGHDQHSQQISDLERRVEEIRAKREIGSNWKPRISRILNTVFMVLAAAGLVQYFYNDADHEKGLTIIAIAMFLKIIELLIRYLG